MKKLIYILTCLALWLGMSGCEKELKDYDGAEGVYFYVQWGAEWGDTTKWANQSYTPVEFVNLVGDTTMVKIRVMTTGRTKAHDRTFRMVVDQDSTTAVMGEEYLGFDENQVVKAGTFYTDVFIPVMRSEILAKEQRELRLKLEATPDFAIGIQVWQQISGMWSSEGAKEFDAFRHIIRMNDFIVKPPRWIGGIYDQPGDTESGRWGVFSEKKYRLICDRFNLAYEDFTTEDKMPGAKQQVIQESMAAYLQELYDKKEPVLEDDGRLMWFMGVSWTSVVGVPWVPED